MSQNPISLLRENENCWRVETAHHASMLIDAENYYRALYEGICRAKHSIFIFGWNVDGRIALVRGEDVPEDECPVTLHELIVHKAKENPKLQIYINQWSYPILLTLDREFMPAARWRIENCPNIHYRFDNVVPLQASHHQKIVIIDDEIAFSGGQDVGTLRWDNRRHHPEDPLRKDGVVEEDENKPYIPNHDVQIVVSGPAAQALAELARRRWFLATDYEAVAVRPYTCKGKPKAWPSKNPPQFEDVRVAISLTFPQIGETPPTRQVEQLFFDQIASAEHFIYIENQYLASRDIARAINRALKQNKNLRVLIFSSRDPVGLAEEVAMWSLRLKFKHLVKRGVRDRVEMVFSVSKSENKAVSVHVHSKVMVIDDKYLRVGSANINDRSMFLDSECDITLVGKNAETRAKIAELRNDLIEEHSGRKKSDIQKLIDQNAPIAEFLKEVPGSDKFLRRIHDSLSPFAQFLTWVTLAKARHRPILDIVMHFFSSHNDKAGFPHKRASMAFLIVMVLAMFLYFNRQIPEDFIRSEHLDGIYNALKNSPNAAWLIIGIFVLVGLVCFPVTVLIAGTAAMLGPLTGLAVAMAGVAASAALSYIIGKVLGKRLFQNYTNTAFLRVRDRIAGAGVLGIAALRLIPIGPFTLVNMILGAMPVTFATFLAGTILGILPGAAAMAILGDSLASIWRNPDPQNLIYMGIALLVWLAVLIGIHFALKSERLRHGKEYVQ